MICTDALHVGFLSSLTIFNETTRFIKTIVLKNAIFKKRTFKKKYRRFYNETIVFQKIENVDIPSDN